MLTELQARRLVDDYKDNVVSIDDVKGLARDGAMPRLRGESVNPYYGKVRANFFGSGLVTPNGVPVRALLTTDNLSAYDDVKGVVPFKAQILNALSNHMERLVTGILPSSQLSTPGSRVVLAENCIPIDMEMVLRRYMAKSKTETSLYHAYVNLGKREFCGHEFPEGLVANSKLPSLVDTPSTKDREGGHDISVTPNFLIENGLVSQEDYDFVMAKSSEAFRRGEEYLEEHGIILVDTKFELGRNTLGDICFIDEILTLDASRYWLMTDYLEKFARREDPVSYSKEHARGLVTKKGKLTPEQIVEVAVRYIMAYQLIMGEEFVPDLRDAKEAIVEDTNNGLEELLAA